MNCLAMALSAGANCSEDKFAFPNRFITSIVGSMNDHPSCRHLSAVRRSDVPPVPPLRLPSEMRVCPWIAPTLMSKSQSKNRSKTRALGATDPQREPALGIGHEEGEEIFRMPVEGPQPRMGLEIFQSCIQIASQLEVVIVSQGC